MVSAYRADALRDPTTELRELFAAHAAAPDFPAEVARHFSTVFSSEEAFAEIPTLDVHHPPESHRDRSLVRFRAMVQDTSPSSEMYLCKTAKGSLSGWGVHEEAEPTFNNEDVDYSQLRECNVLWAVSVPGESEWCREELRGFPAEVETTSPQHTPSRSYKYPQADDSHVGVQVKLYDLDVAEKLKSTDLATFVGILTREPLDHESETASDVPTLHVLFTRTHEQSLLTRPYPSEHPSDVRQELIQWIASEALGGDLDAAEWVLLSSIAKVQSRNPPLLPPSLTLSHFPSPPVPSTAAASEASLPVPALAHVLAQLLPLTRTLPLSLTTLNTARFAPESKDEDLHAGALQLPRGSTLLVTEGGVREGKLVERGLLNLRALQEVMSAQTLAYSFPFSQFDFPTDIRCVVLSEGSKSAFFKTDISVPFQPTSSTPADVSNLYKPAADIAMPDKIAAFRDLVVGAQAGKMAVGEATSEYIQQDFVRDRQQNPAVTSDDLIRRMTVAKLYALSMHAPELTVDIWERAKAFDERRRARLAAF